MKSRIYDNGGYIYIENEFLKGWHKCDDREFWANQKSYDKSLDDKMLKWQQEPIPADIMLNILALANKFPHTEIMVCLYYNKDEKKWLPHVPKQDGSGGAVSYDDKDYTPEAGYFFFGTVHTHPDMQAFWSGTDRNDQCSKDGVHVVLGLKDGKKNTFKCSLWYHGQCYDDDSKVIFPEDCINLPEPPAEWLERIQIKPHAPKYSFDLSDSSEKELMGSQYYWEQFYPQTASSYAFGEEEWSWRPHNESYRNVEADDSLEEDMYALFADDTDENVVNAIGCLIRMLGCEDIADDTVAKLRAKMEEDPFKEPSDSSLPADESHFDELEGVPLD